MHRSRPNGTESTVSERITATGVGIVLDALERDRRTYRRCQNCSVVHRDGLTERYQDCFHLTIRRSGRNASNLPIEGGIAKSCLAIERCSRGCERRSGRGSAPSKLKMIMNEEISRRTRTTSRRASSNRPPQYRGCVMSHHGQGKARLEAKTISSRSGTLSWTTRTFGLGRTCGSRRACYQQTTKSYPKVAT